MATTEDVTVRIDADTAPFADALKDLQDLSKRFGTELTGALKGAAVSGRSLQDVLRQIGLSLAGMALSQGLKPLQSLASSLFSNLVQFLAAEETAPSVWRLSGLLRGQLGTDNAMAAGAAAGASFVLLDEAVRPAGLFSSEIGLSLNWRVGPGGEDFSGPSFGRYTETGGLRALTPLSPVHLKAVAQAGGDIDISWIRRGRIDADSWLAADIPLGEETEAYQVDIAPAEGDTVRSVTVSSPMWSYAAGAVAEDFPVPPEAVRVTVRQVSAAVGPGLPASVTFPLG
jgi:hypothetical protein